MLALGVLIGMGAGRLDAQVFTPTYMSPQRYDEIGIYLNDGPGNFSVEGLWRRTLGDFDLGFRAAIVARRGSLLLLGAEFRTPYPIPDVPLQTAFTGGVQGVIGSEGGAGFQAGMTTGFPIVLPDFTFVPYIHPRLALRSGIGRDGLELDPLADVGFDFVIPQDLIIRFAIGLGRGTADWGLGVSWR